MKKYYLLLILLIFIPGFVLAEDYPVEELGGCQNKEECRSYCDKLENLEPCLEYGKKENLLEADKILKGEAMAVMGITEGPGGCKTISECRNYCNDFNNVEECFNFVKANKLTTGCDLEGVEGMVSAIKEGIEPPNCRGKEECKQYCSISENLDKCLYFAQSAGFLSKEEALLIRKTGGKGPGECQGEDNCRLYCDDPAHMEECFNFAVENGFVSETEAEQALSIKALAEEGGPGDCTGLKECSEYCSQETNIKECIEFTKEAGIISEEEGKEIEKIVEEGGPGGCKTKGECSEYCGNIDNLEECISFMLGQGYLTEENIKILEEELDKAEEMIKNQTEEFRNNYPGEHDLEINEEQIKKDLEEELKPYRDLIEEYKKKSSLRQSSRSIAKIFNPSVLKEKTRLISKALESSRPNNVAGFLSNFLASSVRIFLK